MSNTEFNYLIKEIISIKQSLATDNGFIKNLIAIMPATITSIATIFVAMWAFNRTTRREREFKKENEIKEKNDLHRKLFGEVFKLSSSYVNALISSNNFRIETAKYQHLIKNNLYKFDIDKANDIKSLETSKANYKNSIDKIIEVKSNLNGQIGEYIILFNENKIVRKFNELSRANYQFEFDINAEYAKCDTPESYQNKERDLMDRAVRFVVLNNNEILKDLLEIIKTKS